MVTVSLSPGEWIHLSWVGHRRMVWKGYRPWVRLVLAGGHASAWFSPFWRGPAPGAQRYQANLQSAHYLLLKAKQQAREVFWVDIPVPEKLDENIQAQVALLHMIADYKAHIVREMEYAQNELLVPVVYPDGIELSSGVDEELHDVRENCFPRSP